MTSLISIFFLLLAITVFIALIGLPVWITIYLVKQYKKNKKLSMIQIVLAIIIGIVVVNSLRGLPAGVLKIISQNYGVDEIQVVLPVEHSGEELK